MLNTGHVGYSAWKRFFNFSAGRTEKFAYGQNPFSLLYLRSFIPQPVSAITLQVEQCQNAVCHNRKHAMIYDQTKIMPADFGL
jgi:hypothetical protein